MVLQPARQGGKGGLSQHRRNEGRGSIAGLQGLSALRNSSFTRGR